MVKRKNEWLRGKIISSQVNIYQMPSSPFHTTFEMHKARGNIALNEGQNLQMHIEW